MKKFSSCQNYVTVNWYSFSKSDGQMVCKSRDIIVRRPSDLMDVLAFARSLREQTPYHIQVTDGQRCICFSV